MRKTLCLLLAALLLAGSMLSCAGKTENKTPAETADGKTASGTVGGLSDLPDGLTFDGAEFKVASRGTCSSVDQEEIIGDNVLDGIYNRNRLAEEKLNIKIKEDKSEDTKLESMITAVKSGDMSYSAGITHITRMADYMMEGYLLNTEMIPYLDFSKPYWSETVVDSLAIAGKRYLFSGDVSITDDTCVWCVYFNKELMESLGLESPYGPLEEGRWTMDMFAKDASAAANDMNGDGRWDWKDDRFGVCNLYETICGLYNGMGQMSVARNSDGTLAFALASDTSVNALMKLAKWLSEGQDTYLLDVSKIDTGDSNWDDLRDVFKTGRALFQVGTIAALWGYRDMEQPFGILPMPKYDEKQQDYVSSTQEWGQSVYGIPVCAPDMAMAGAVLEYLCDISTDTVRKPFYDVALTRKMSRDQESSVSLDILFSSIVIDPGFCYFSLRSMVEDIAKSGTVSSKIQSKEKSVNRDIAQHEKIITKLDH